MEEKKKLLVSFSGGETSAFMVHWLKENKSDEFEMVFVFANTGQENEETLKFANYIDKKYNLNLIWVEAVVNPEFGKGIRHKIVDFETASRNGQPFEKIIEKYGIPNMNAPHCSRGLKEQPIKSFIKSLGWDEYFTAIGIRVDEFDRMNAKKDEKKLIYPLVDMRPTNKQEINNFWNKQEYRLELKGYEGNCATCWKKSMRKLGTIAKYNPEKFDFFEKMEQKYENYLTPSMAKAGKAEPPIRFFRKNLSVKDVKLIPKDPHFQDATDDSVIYDFQTTMNFIELDSSNGCEESCEAF